MDAQLSLFHVACIEPDDMATVFDRVSDTVDREPQIDLSHVVVYVALATHGFDGDKAVATCMRIAAALRHVQRHPSDADAYRTHGEHRLRFPRALARAAGIAPLAMGACFAPDVLRAHALAQIDCGGAA